ncbi:MAG: tripartite tricarboxylate transporter substrate binding protein [Betaproteobacteria bacterium]|nr:tripartite tricarboxylate transporter substrate binding protein [Betaproteobacteria bacterium]
MPGAMNLPQWLNYGPASFLLAAGMLCVFATPANAAEWKPTKRVEIIVPSGPGGGNDRVARLVHKLILDGRLVEAVTTVVNKPGGGGAIGYAYLNQYPGDGHSIAITSVTLVADHITGRTAVGYNDVTPVAQLFTEYVGFAVRPDSRIKTGRDLLALLKTDAGSVSAAIATTLGNHNHVALGLVARAAGGDARKLRIAVFNSGGESITAALGGHVDLVVTPAATALPHVQAGRLRFIAVTSPRRLAGALAEVPTWQELGANATVSNWRVMVGPKEMTSPQISYWENILGRVVQFDEWRGMLERDVLTGEYRRSAETREFLKAQYEELKGILTELGLVKQP